MKNSVFLAPALVLIALSGCDSSGTVEPRFSAWQRSGNLRVRNFAALTYGQLATATQLCQQVLVKSLWNQVANQSSMDGNIQYGFQDSSIPLDGSDLVLAGATNLRRDDLDLYFTTSWWSGQSPQDRNSYGMLYLEVRGLKRTLSFDIRNVPAYVYEGQFHTFSDPNQVVQNVRIYNPHSGVVALSFNTPASDLPTALGFDFGSYGDCLENYFVR